MFAVGLYICWPTRLATTPIIFGARLSQLRLTERIHSLTSVALLSSLAALFLIEQLRSIKTKIVTEAV